MPAVTPQPRDSRTMRVPMAPTTTLLGLAAGGFGLAVIAGWLAHVPFLITLRLDQDPVPLNAGAGLDVAGFTWAWGVSADRRPWPAIALMSGALVLIGPAALSRTALHRGLGVHPPG